MTRDSADPRGARAPRIAMFVHRLDLRALARLTVEVADALRRIGVPVTVVAAAEDPDARRRLPEGLPVSILGARVDRTTFAVPRLAAWLGRRTVDVLFAHGNGPNRAAVLARGIARVPTRIVTVEHNHYSSYVSPSGGGYSFLPLRDRLTRWLYGRADVVAGVAPDIVADLQDRFGGGGWRTAVLPDPGRSPEDIARLAAERVDHPWYRDPAGPWTVCSVGNLVPRKGQHVLIEALPRLREQVGDVALVLVGRADWPPYRDRLLETAERLGVRDRLHLAGFQANPISWIAGADAFALASYNEGCPRVLSEALACGVPVVAADCPSGPAFILEGGATGRLVPVGDAPATADALASVLLDRDLRQRLVARGRTRAAEFTPARVAERYLELARSLVEPGEATVPRLPAEAG